MKIDTVIYDFDGVIGDTAKDIAGAVIATEKHFGEKVLGTDEIISYVGFGAKYLVRKSLPNIPDEEFDDVLKWYKAYYYAHPIVETKLYPTVCETLKILHNAGVKQFIVSNKPEQITKEIVEGLGVAKYFTKVIGPESVTNMKPDPEALFMCMKTANSKKALMLGDSYTDIQAGKSAGTLTGGCRYGIGNKEKLLSAEADFYVDSLGEILEHIEY